MLMEFYWKRKSSVTKLALPFYCFFFIIIFSCFLFCSLFIISSTKSLDINCPFSGEAEFFYFQEKSKREEMEVAFIKGRKILSGPGSSPPRCTSKCGRCTPCKPVHVPVPPGTPVTAEYYPEAWRCKCGNKLYMP